MNAVNRKAWSRPEILGRAAMRPILLGRLHIFLNQLGFLTVTIEKALRAPFALMLS